MADRTPDHWNQVRSGRRRITPDTDEQRPAGTPTSNRFQAFEQDIEDEETERSPIVPISIAETLEVLSTVEPLPTADPAVTAFFQRILDSDSNNTSATEPIDDDDDSIDIDIMGADKALEQTDKEQASRLGLGLWVGVC